MSSVAKKVTDLLDAAGMAYEIYSFIKPNATTAGTAAEDCDPGKPREVSVEDIKGLISNLI